MFSRAPTPLTFDLAAKPLASRSSQPRMTVARASDKRSLTSSVPLRLVWPTMFRQLPETLAALATSRSHIG
ncbi:hypothetical protein D3C83_179130 [compost metagenome]